MHPDMMKHLILTVSLLLGLLLPTACTDTAEQASDREPMLTLTFETSAARLTSRTTLASSDPVQHVSHVQLYIYKGVTADAPCILSRDVNWAQPTGATAQQSFALPLSVFSPDGTTTYTFLAVGLDGDAGSTEGSAYAYGLPDAVGVGSTLGEAVARLASGRTATDMAHAELFAGTAILQVQPGTDNAVTIDLFRRVAGVQVYVTDIPTDVTRLQLLLHMDQHSEVPLCRQEDAADGTLLDHGTAQLDGSSVLLDIPVTDETKQGQTLSGTSLTKQEGSVIGAAYLLPIEAPPSADASTLVLQAYKGTSLYRTYRVALGHGATRTFRYPLRANCFYAIGVLNSKENEPASLGEAESDITIEVEPNFEKDHEYDIQ